MADQETWAQRVAEWKTSGLTSPEFCAGKDFTPGGLRHMAHRLGVGRRRRPRRLRIAKVLRAKAPQQVESAPPSEVIVELGQARVVVRTGVRGAHRDDGEHQVIPHGVEIFVGLDPIDLRWSFDRLAGIAAERIGREARCGALFVFFGKRRDALKVLFFDGSGMCLFYKRLDAGTFRLPDVEPGATSVAIDERALDDLLDGIDVETKRKSTRLVRTH